MKRSSLLLVSVSILLGLAGCTAEGPGGNTTATNMDVDAPLSS